jgi:hypothetical protein
VHEERASRFVQHGIDLTSSKGLFGERDGLTSWGVGLLACSGNTAWAVGQSGTVVSTTDSGVTWSTSATGASVDYFGVRCVPTLLFRTPSLTHPGSLYPRD